MATILVTVRRGDLSVPLAGLYADGHVVRAAPGSGRVRGAELIQALEGCSAVIAAVEPYTAEVFDATPWLRHVSRVGVGLDAVDLRAATARGVIVTNTPGANAMAVADFTFGLILSAARSIPIQDRDAHQGTWQPRIGTEIWRQTLGIVGLGNIGRGVARRARGFEMRLLAYDPFVDEAAAGALDVELVSIDRLFAEADFVTLHLPASAETERIVDARLLGRMKPSAYLINAARGALVDEDALYQALEERRIAGAALDVRQTEPPTDTRFAHLDNVVLTPHAAGSTGQAVTASVRAAAEAVRRVLRGERPEGLANPDVWDRIAAGR